MKPAKKLTAAVAALAVSSSIFTGVANAAPDPATGVELNVPLSRTVTLDVISNQGADVQKALYDIRGEMWDRNVPFEGTTLREAARKAGYNNKDVYVNAARVDSNMSFIAAQRAAETLVWPSLAHKRPTNDSCEISDCASVWSATRNGEQSWGENLSSSANLRYSIMELWGRGEESALRAAKGHPNDQNGHLWLMINPKYTAYGAANAFSYVNGGLKEASSMQASTMRKGDGKYLEDTRTELKVADNGKIRPGKFPNNPDPSQMQSNGNGGFDITGLLGSLATGKRARSSASSLEFWA